MPDRPDGGLEDALKKLTEGLSEVLREQRAQGERLGGLEDRLGRVEEGVTSSQPPPAPRLNTYDYRVLQSKRRYTIEDVKGQRAKMLSLRRCLALTDLPEIRTRYHTGTGQREACYAFRAVQEDAARKPEWTPLEYRIDKGAGADFSAYLVLPEAVRSGDVFEIRHEIELIDSFTSRNEWVTLVVEYPTEMFLLEVVLPPGRRVHGARREESEGASNSFNKRRVFPRALDDTGQIILEWEETSPVTGRAYTLFWDW